MVGLAVSSMACGSPARPVPPTTSAKAALFYSDVELAPGRTFPSPLVRGSVNGKATILVVDTGAQVSVIDEKLAIDAKLEVGAAVDGRDPSGNAVAMRRTERPGLGIDGLGAIAEHPTAVAALPSIFTRLGIGAILSPQALADGLHDVILDLAQREIRIVDRAPASHQGSVADVCRFAESGLAARALVAKAVIDGIPTVVELDTGASGTFVVSSSDVGRKLERRTDAERAEAMGAAGPIDVIRVGRATASIGSLTLDGPVTIMPGEKDGSCGYEARLGIDRLRNCTLVISETSASVTCPTRV